MCSCPSILKSWITSRKMLQMQMSEIFVSVLITVQRDTTQSSLIYYSTSSLYMFRVSSTRIIRCTQNCNYRLRYRSYFICSYLPPTWPSYSLATLEGGSWPVQEAVVTVLCTPDYGCGWHPKHVEWTCRIINRLLCVASRWTIINIDQRCTEP